MGQRKIRVLTEAGTLELECLNPEAKDASDTLPAVRDDQLRSVVDGIMEALGTKAGQFEHHTTTGRHLR